MKVQYRIPATVTGAKEKNYCQTVKNLFNIFLLWRKAKKEKASQFVVFFEN